MFKRLQKFRCVTFMVATVLALSACQTSQVYNGSSGYQVLIKNEQFAILNYTLAVRGDAVNQAKLQSACQAVLGKGREYQIEILSRQEIVNPQTSREAEHYVVFPRSKVQFGLSNAPHQHDTQGYATRQALDVQPTMLSVVQYRCE